MKFAILIHASPYSQSGSHTAYQFIKAAVAKGHQVIQVFFYGDGVYHANALCSPQQDEINFPLLWENLAKQHSLQLIACVASASQRGILGAGDAEYHGKGVSNLNPSFRTAGLGQFVEAMIASYRVLVF